MLGRHATGNPIQQKCLRQPAIVAGGNGQPLGNGGQTLATAQ